jgi:hypothetical protein
VTALKPVARAGRSTGTARRCRCIVGPVYASPTAHLTPNRRGVVTRRREWPSGTQSLPTDGPVVQATIRAGFACLNHSARSPGDSREGPTARRDGGLGGARPRVRSVPERRPRRVR